MTPPQLLVSLKGEFLNDCGDCLDSEHSGLTQGPAGRPVTGSLEQDRPSEPSAQMAGGGALARLSEREAIIMQMQQVDYFLTLCEELNFTRAKSVCRTDAPTR